MTLTIRHATEADLPAILEIYNDAVANTLAIFNETLVDLDNRREWFLDRQAKSYPVLVAERNGAVLGYASYGDWRAFEGFRHSKEHSVYIRSDVRGGGIGRALMEELIVQARQNKVHVLIAGIEGSNEASIRLHEKLGFQLNGRFPETGIKFGKWLDLVFMQLILQDKSDL